MASVRSTDTRRHPVPGGNGAATVPALGVAYSRAAASLVSELADLIDYVEFPYELITRDAAAAALATDIDAVLHCASLSLASGDRSNLELARDVDAWASRIESPWIGEHLSFVSVEGDAGTGDESLTYDIGFAVSPPMCMQTVDQVAHALHEVGSVVTHDILVENSPIYLLLPGTSMRQSEVFNRLVERTDVGVLLDLAHLIISCDTYGIDPVEELLRFPLERVVEVHLSGIARDSGVLWDDHASSPSALEYQLLIRLLDRAPVAAVTHEYNWAPCFPIADARRELIRTAQLIEAR